MAEQSGGPGGGRLRFSDFTLERLASGRCRARVVLTLHEDQQYTGESEGLASQAGELRCVAQACVEALGQAVQDVGRFELLGVKAVRAFDATVVIASLSVSTEPDGQRLVGCYLTADADPSRGAAIAVLNATNRLVGNRFFAR
jgi:hypothetical protein